MSNGTNSFLMFVFASLFLVSLGIVHNASADIVTDTIPMGNTLPSGIGENPNTDKIYVAITLSSFSSPSCYGSENKIDVIDGATDKVTGSVTVGYDPVGVGVNPDTNKIYASSRSSYTVSVIDGTSDTVVDTIPVASPTSVGVNPNTNKIYVTDSGHGKIDVIDGATNNVTGTIPVGSSYLSYPGDLAVDANANKVYVIITADKTVAVINGTTNAVIGTVSGFSSPQGIAVNPSTNKIYVSDAGTGKVDVINGTSDTIVGSVPVGSSPYGVTVNPTTGRIYVSNYGDDTVSVINGKTDTVVGTLQSYSKPDSVAANPSTNKIYVVNTGGQYCPPRTASISVIQANSTDGTAPTSPQGLQSATGKAYVALSWTASSSDGGSPITNYKIYKSATSGSETLLTQIGNTTSYNDTAVSNGQAYFYKVTALNAIGESLQSNETSATVPLIVPSAPAGLVASAVSSSQVNLNWGPPPNNGGSAITGYTIERSTDNGTTWSTIVANTENASPYYPDTGLQGNTTYTYRVSAINSVGMGLPSNTASATTTATSSVTIPVGGAYGVATNPSTNKVYVANGNADKIQVIDGTANIIIATISTASTNCGTYAVAVNPATNLLYANNNACTYWRPSSVPWRIPQTVSVINGNTNMIVATVTLPSNSPWFLEAPEPLAANPVTNKIYALHNNGESISVIDGATNRLITDMAISTASSSPRATDIAVNPQTNTVYVLDGTVIHVINGTTDSIVNSFSWGKSSNEGIGINPATNKIYVSNSDDSVSVIDGTNNQVVGNVSSTTYGFAAVNPSTNKIYISSPGGGQTISVIDGSTNTMAGNVTAGSSPYGLGVNTATNKIYVGNSGSATISVIDGKTANTSTVSSAPQNLQATTGNSQVSLLWTAPSSNGDSSITNYNIYRGTSSGSETLLATTGNVTSYIDNAVTNGQTYFYKVTAVNSVGESSQSNEVNVTPAAPVTVSSAPTALTATTVSSSQINLGWTTPSSNGGSTVTGYMIQRSTDSGTTWSTIASNTGSAAAKYNDTGLSPSTTYAYQVSAINSVGTSPPSNTASATTNAVMASGIVLNNVQSTSGTTSSSNQITLSGFNAGTGSNKLLLVGISANNNSPVSVTFNGIQLTQAVMSFYNNDAEFWYLDNPSGSGDVVVTMNGPTQAVVGEYSFSGVNQTMPIPTHAVRHNINPNSPTISITTKYPNDLVLDLPSIYGGSTLGSPTCTQQWDANIHNVITGASSTMVVLSPATVTCKWTASSADFWDDVAVELKAN